LNNFWNAHAEEKDRKRFLCTSQNDEAQSTVKFFRSFNLYFNLTAKKLSQSLPFFYTCGNINFAQYACLYVNYVRLNLSIKCYNNLQIREKIIKLQHIIYNYK